MRAFLLAAAVSVGWLSLGGLSGATQAPVTAGQPRVDATNAAASATPMARPSEVLQVPLKLLQDALSGVRLEKWKMSGELRDATDGDIRSIEQDFRETLPPLLATADSEPGSVAKVLPAIRNVDALYNVAVRVSAMGRLAAPAAQGAALDKALQGVAEARRQLADQLQASAVAQENRVGELQASLKASQAAAAAAASAAPQQSPAPVLRPKKKVRPKPAAEAGGAVGTAGGSVPAKP